MHELILILQIYIGARDSLDAPFTDMQWEQALEEARRQSLVGVFNEVVQHLPPAFKPPMKIKLQSAFVAELIAKRNSVMDKHCEEITSQFHQMGLECCILKGQGLANLYPHPQTRSCGDIDVWVKGKAEDTISALSSRWKVREIHYHHASMHPFEDKTEVEVHYRPSCSNNPFIDRKMQRYFSAQSSRQFNNNTAGLGFPTPEIRFHCVFCAIHAYRHLIHLGVGLRHIMDYYYLLLNSSEQDRAAVTKVLTDLKMKRFMSALMYTLHEWFLLSEEYFLVPANEEYGLFLMNEIQSSGNFGQFDKRYVFKQNDNILKLIAVKVSRIRHFMSIAPLEVLWAPYFKVRQYLWEKRHSRILPNANSTTL